MKFPTITAKPVAKLVFKTKQHSPTLLLAVGAVGVVTSTVAACRATLKLNELLEEQADKSEKLRTLETIDEQEITKALVAVRTQTSMQIVKLYLPAVGIGVVSLGCFVASNRVLAARNTALVAAYAGLERTYDAYRARVIEELGEEKESKLHYGDEIERVETKDGKSKSVLKAGASKYAFFFDELSTSFSDSPQANQMWIRTQMAYANDLLRARGHVFLNEVHDMLGVPRTPAGAIVGWILDNNENGDNYIDFGVFEGDVFSAMQFVNGDERAIMLDPNVDGVIYDKI